MSRYIDADEAIEIIKNDSPEMVYYSREDAIECLKCTPPADVVEVTRCKYCKFYEPYDKPPVDSDGRCFARNCETDEYDFCNYGVMKKEYEK